MYKIDRSFAGATL